MTKAFRCLKRQEPRRRVSPLSVREAVLRNPLEWRETPECLRLLALPAILPPATMRGIEPVDPYEPNPAQPPTEGSRGLEECRSPPPFQAGRYSGRNRTPQ